MSIPLDLLYGINQDLQEWEEDDEEEEFSKKNKGPAKIGETSTAGAEKNKEKEDMFPELEFHRTDPGQHGDTEIHWFTIKGTHKKHGLKWVWKNENLAWIGTYDNDKPHGLFQEYDTFGKLLLVSVYRNGELIHRQEFPGL